MTANRDFNVLTVTAPAGFQTKVEEAIKEYDLQPVPARNIELTVYAVTGADAAAPVPKELEPIEKQFHRRRRLQRRSADRHPGNPRPPRTTRRVG